MRARTGLSQTQLAARLGCKQRAVSKLESGQTEPRVADLIVIAKVCETTLDGLLDGVHVDDVIREIRAGNSP